MQIASCSSVRFSSLHLLCLIMSQLRGLPFHRRSVIPSWCSYVLFGLHCHLENLEVDWRLDMCCPGEQLWCVRLPVWTLPTEPSSLDPGFRPCSEYDTRSRCYPGQASQT